MAIYAIECIARSMLRAWASVDEFVPDLLGGISLSLLFMGTKVQILCNTELLGAQVLPFIMLLMFLFTGKYTKMGGAGIKS